MHEAGAAGYRRLNRNSFAGFSVTRNVSSFLLLIGLAVFVVLFYLYFSANNELQDLKQEYINQGDYSTKLKNELLELNMKMETLRATESTCQASKTSLDAKYQECMGENGHKKSAIEDLEGSKRDKETQIQNLKNELDEAKKLAKKLGGELDDLRQQNNTENNTVVTMQKNIIEKLTQEVAQKDQAIAQLKSNSPPSLALNSSLSPTSGLTTTAPTTATELLSPAVKPVVSDKEQMPQPPHILQAVGVAPPVQSATPKNGSTTTIAAVLVPQAEDAHADPPAAPQSMSHKAAEVNSEGDLNGGEPGDEGEPAGAAANKNNEVNDEIRSGQGEFLAERQPGGRVKLEEVNQAKQDGAKAMDAPLLKAAQDTANNEVVKKTDEGADEAVVDLPKAAKEISNEAENADDKNL